MWSLTEQLIHRTKDTWLRCGSPGSGSGAWSPASAPGHMNEAAGPQRLCAPPPARTAAAAHTGAGLAGSACGTRSDGGRCYLHDDAAHGAPVGGDVEEDSRVGHGSD